MKTFQTYIAELNTAYTFRVKIAGVEPTGEVFERIKNALDTYQIESISKPKRMPIQEHREFPKLGPCECYVMEVTVKYPTTPVQIRQVIGARAMIDPTCLCVYNEDTAAQEDAVQERIDNQGAVLTEPEMKTDAAPVAGQELVSSFLKELETRKYEFAAKSEANDKTTNEVPQNTKSIVKPNTTPRGK
jgi:hypothetical protein